MLSGLGWTRAAPSDIIDLPLFRMRYIAVYTYYTYLPVPLQQIILLCLFLCVHEHYSIFCLTVKSGAEASCTGRRKNRSSAREAIAPTLHRRVRACYIMHHKKIIYYNIMVRDNNSDVRRSVNIMSDSFTNTAFLFHSSPRKTSLCVISTTD